MSLPAAWIDRVFDKMTLAYGKPFLNRWEGMDINTVKSDWAHELAGFERHPEAIAWALQNLPDAFPPTVMEFRALARKAPMPEVPRIEHSPAGKERIEAELKRLRPVLREKPKTDFRDWARRIVARKTAGDKTLTRTQIEMAEDALKGIEGYA